ncbi:ABC transporter ATP-binding protein [Ktedonobacter sp. SOSP1-85]|uniref:ABC transporter ATP-binding protein n=1 Tax=Ktedonobacter sp. SOSP1-85 TaxID=2778367 RepID=UPI001915C1B0|nr:ABC transporter ATP-binding protein [Ktedonobacter sp. SOSP1-85]
MRIEISALHKEYRGGVKALQNLNLTIPGGMFGLLGPNGAGKTTLMRTLAGILRPTSGSIRVGAYDGTTERGRDEIKGTLGYLPQDLGMYPDLSAREFLNYVAILKGVRDRQTRRQQVEALLEMVALSDVANRKLKTYSGGMKRRVGIAQALVNNPQFIIVDEPTAGLDPQERIRFRNLLSDLGGQRTVLLSTHIVEDIAQTCQNLAVMRVGCVVFQGTLSQLLQQAQGRVWQMALPMGERPDKALTVVSALHNGPSVLYRIVSEEAPAPNALAVEPSLEDGYVWLMREQRPEGLVTGRYA